MMANVNYMSRDVPTGLFAEYKFPPRVGVRRDKNGDDVEAFGVDVVPVAVHLENGREASFSLDADGVELLADPFVPHDFLNFDEVVSQYYEECVRLVQKATGARKVIAFDHNVRSVHRFGSPMGGGFNVQPPLELVHGDYTEESARRRVRDLTKPLRKNDTLKKIYGDRPPLEEDADELLGKRFQLVNVWRSIHEAPIERKPLAVLNPNSVPLEDFVVHEIHYADRIGENYNARHGQGHRWSIFPGMTRDEVMLLKVWDSAGQLARHRSPGPAVPATFSFHAAVEVPVRREAPSRESIEVRTLVLY